MRLPIFLCVLSCVIVTSCGTPRVPEALVRPPESEAVNVVPVRRSTDTTAKEVREAQKETIALEGELVNAQNRAQEASDLADEALRVGLERGSKEAAKLAEASREVKKSLESANAKVKVLSVSLTKAEESASEAQKDVQRLEVSIALVESELDAYKGLIDAANARIEATREFEEEARGEIAKLESQRDLSRVWTRRWFFGTIGLATIIGLYIYFRLQRFPWIL